MNGHRYTDEQKRWLQDHRPHCPMPVIASGFNARFSLSINAKALHSACKRFGIKAADNGQFQKGHISHNKGRKGWASEKSKQTAFKPGNYPHNALPVGSELWKFASARDGDIGYLSIKIADPNVWKPKHRLLWEAAHGPQPAGTAIIFLDGDRRNIRLDNLECVTRSALCRLNQMGYVEAHDEIKPTILALAKLHAAAGARKQQQPDFSTHGDNPP